MEALEDSGEVLGNNEEVLGDSARVCLEDNVVWD